MRIKELFRRHAGEDVYIVGTGPSMRVFPYEVLDGKITIGLNQAWRYGPLTYNITVHPELLLEYEDTVGAETVQWIVKKKPPMYHLELTDPSYYVFHTKPNLSTIGGKDPDTLFLGHGIQQTAMHLAALMGARTIYLVGVDMCDLGGDHHGHVQHVRFHSIAPPDVYSEYRRYTASVRRQIQHVYGIPTLTLSPLLGAGHGDEDYLRLCEERGLSKLPPPPDTSKYAREKTDEKPPE